MLPVLRYRDHNGSDRPAIAIARFAAYTTTMYVQSEQPQSTVEQSHSSDEMTVQDAHRRFIDEDLRLSPRSRRTYDYSLRCFLEFVERDFGLVAATAPVTDLKIEHVTAFVSKMMPRDLRQPEDVSRMRTVQTQLAAIRKW